jgi:hypothetical protein
MTSESVEPARSAHLVSEDATSPQLDKGPALEKHEGIFFYTSADHWLTRDALIAEGPAWSHVGAGGAIRNI